MAYLDKSRRLWEVLEPITETFIKTRMGDLKSTDFNAIFAGKRNRKHESFGNM